MPETDPSSASGGAASPLVSVVIPAYEAEATLDATLASVRAQTHAALEVLVVDDGSTDGTRAIIDRHAAADPRVVAIDYGGNRGRSHARNTAIDASRGEWVAFVDADDLWCRQRVERLLGAAAAFGGTTVVCDDRMGFEVGGDGRVSLTHRSPTRATMGVGSPHRIDPRTWFIDKLCHMDPMVHRSRLVDGGPRYPEDLASGEDLCFCLQLVFGPGAAPVVRSGDPSYYYRWGATDRAAGSAGSVHAAITRAVELTGSGELRELFAAAWPGLGWRFEREDGRLAAAGRVGAPDPGATRGDLGTSVVTGYVSLVREKLLQYRGLAGDRSLRPAIVADIERQLRAGS